MIIEVMFEAQTYIFDFQNDTTLENMCAQICSMIPWIKSEEIQTKFTEYFPSIYTRLDQSTLTENSVLQFVTFR